MMFHPSEHSEQDYGFIDVKSWMSGGASATADPVALTGIALNVLPLRRGAKGAQVTQLQRVLKETGNDPGKIDGDFGARTEAAVLAFQRARGVAATGVVDETTLRWLNQMLINVRQGGKPDAHAAPPLVQPASPVEMTLAAETTPFYAQPWFTPAAVGTGLVVAAGVGYLLLRRR
jgi:peptidoglycan hydrolase-like protein with peptidoglycan-binding domain